MTGQEAAAVVLLSVGVAIQVLSAVGLTLMRSPYDRLHVTGPASVLAPSFVAAAVVLERSFTSGGIMAILVAAVLLLSSPVLTHATAKAVRAQERGGWRLQPEERTEVS